MPLDNIAKRAEAYKPKDRVTYKMIKEYTEAKYGFKVHTAYIAGVKRQTLHHFKLLTSYTGGSNVHLKKYDQKKYISDCRNLSLADVYYDTDFSTDE